MEKKMQMKNINKSAGFALCVIVIILVVLVIALITNSEEKGEKTEILSQIRVNVPEGSSSLCQEHTSFNTTHSITFKICDDNNVTVITTPIGEFHNAESKEVDVPDSIEFHVERGFSNNILKTTYYILTTNGEIYVITLDDILNNNLSATKLEGFQNIVTFRLLHEYIEKVIGTSEVLYAVDKFGDIFEIERD